MTYGELFAGVGMASYGFQKAGWQEKWFVEIEDYPHQTYQRNFPESKGYYDIKDCGKHNLEPVDVIFGGWPCQPFSTAGKQMGTEDDRDLWPEMLRVIKELRPRWVIGENVAQFLSVEFHRTKADLESIGYEVGPPLIIPASAVEADHRRNRAWIIANSLCQQCETGSQFNRRIETPLTGVSNIPQIWSGVGESRLDRGLFNAIATRVHEPTELHPLTQIKENRVNRLKALGNGLMWQIPYIIAMGINEMESAEGEVNATLP